MWELQSYVYSTKGSISLVTKGPKYFVLNAIVELVKGNKAHKKQKEKRKKKKETSVALKCA